MEVIFDASYIIEKLLNRKLHETNALADMTQVQLENLR